MGKHQISLMLNNFYHKQLCQGANCLHQITVGLIPSPDLPAQIAGNIKEHLQTGFKQYINTSSSWNVDIVIDPLVGTAEYMNDMINQATSLKHKNDWDYVICLTDLPQFTDNHVVLADVSTSANIAFISIPALGMLSMTRRVLKMIYQTMNDLYHKQDYQLHKGNWSERATCDTDHLATKTRMDRHQNKQLHHSNRKLQIYTKKEIPHFSLFPLLKIKQIYIDETTSTVDREQKEEGHTQQNTDNKVDIRYIIASKVIGQIMILVGMTYANRPWTALLSFRKVIILAFGTGTYMTIFPSSWDLSIVYTWLRFLILTLIALIAMVIWIILAHQLWETPTRKSDERLRKLYNYTTISTLSLITIINYFVLYGLFLLSIALFVPPELFQKVTDLAGDPSPAYYFRLTWIITSLGTLAGAIGATSQNEDKVRSVTYSYRQMQRYYDIQEEEQKEQKQEEKTSEDAKEA